MTMNPALMREEHWNILHPPTRELILGLDLGQMSDYSALAIAERTPPGAPDPATWAVNHLERWPLGTSYPSIVAAVAARTSALLAIRPPLDVTLILDATGVGRPVLDMFTPDVVGLSPFALTITGGEQVHRDGREISVPKRDLVSTVAVLLQSERVKIAGALPLASTLVAELQNMRVKISLSGHARFEAGPPDPTDAWRLGAHDDLVLATAMALWYGEHGRQDERVYADPESSARYRAFLEGRQ